MSRVWIVRWMLEEIGQPYRTKLLEYDTTMMVSTVKTKRGQIPPSDPGWSRRYLFCGRQAA
jgi:hypothetical protein